MDYFKIFDLKKEPFSNSPDPEFFFHSRQHMGCLQKIELALRLQKGLNVVIGEVGTGKTTLCRQLIRKFASDDSIETHLILDPHFSSAREFLSVVTKMLWKARPKKGTTDWQLKEFIKKYLFRRGVHEGKNIVLLIDEGQKLPDFCLECLREFLNYETNEHKLLQIVIFAQKEFKETLIHHKNFADRINLLHTLSPLNFEETRAMIGFRLHKARNGRGGDGLFTLPALWAIYRTTKGYPRRIINLCHRIVLTMIIQNRSRAGWFTARTCSKRYFPTEPARWRRFRLCALTAVLLICVLFGLGYFRLLTIPTGWTSVILKQEPRRATRQIGSSPLQRAIPRLTDLPKPPVPPITPRRKAEAVQIAQGRIPAPDNAKSNFHSTPVRKTFPPLLGHLTVTRKETIGGMIQRIYGEYTNEHLRLVTRANKKMTNPNRLVSGQVIGFPAIPLKSMPPEAHVCWVQVARKRQLQEAYKFLRDYPDDLPPIRLIPYWNGKEGLRFALIDKKHFSDEASAVKYLKRLPPALASAAEIRKGWGGPGTVLFANPLL